MNQKKQFTASKELRWKHVDHVCPGIYGQFQENGWISWWATKKNNSYIPLHWFFNRDRYYYTHITEQYNALYTLNNKSVFSLLRWHLLWGLPQLNKTWEFTHRSSKDPKSSHISIHVCIQFQIMSVSMFHVSVSCLCNWTLPCNCTVSPLGFIHPIEQCSQQEITACLWFEWNHSIACQTQGT